MGKARSASSTAVPVRLPGVGDAIREDLSHNARPGGCPHPKLLLPSCISYSNLKTAFAGNERLSYGSEEAPKLLVTVVPHGFRKADRPECLKGLQQAAKLLRKA